MFGIDIKTVLTSAVVAVVVVVLSGLVGGNQPGVGGTRFPNGLSADGTSPAAGEVRGTTLTVTTDGSFSDDVVVGAANSVAGVIYIGAADGCTALYAAASTTLTAQATSTSFCN